MSDTFAHEAIATIGDNAKTLITGDDLSEYLNMTYAEIVARADAIIAKAGEYMVITNDAEDAAATEFLVKVRACWNAAEAARVAEKSPYDDAAGVVHAHFKKRVLDLLGLAPADKRIFDPSLRRDLGVGPRINMAQTIYKTAKMEDERRRRQEEERLARIEEDRKREEANRLAEEAREAERAAGRKRNAEAMAKAEAEAAELRRRADVAREEENHAAEARAAATTAANATAADMTRSRGDRGGVSSLKEFVDFRDIDRTTLDYAKIGPYLTDKAIEQAIRAYADANKATVQNGIKSNDQPVRGVIFFIAHKSAGRA